MKESKGLLFGRYATNIVLALIFAFPVAWTVLRSFQTVSTAAKGLGKGMFDNLTTANYSALQDSGTSLWSYTFNSVILAVGTMALTTLLATLAGYGFSRLRFPGSNLIFLLVLMPFMVPYQTIITPLYTVVENLHLTDSLIGLILIYTTFQLPFCTLVMRSSFSAVPKELEESAMIDGLSSFGILFRALLPIVKPGMATAALYSFIFAWNDFLTALIMVSDSDKYPLPVALVNMQTGQFGTVDYGLLSSGATVATIPCLLMFLLLQRYYVSGLSAGAVKG